MLRVVSCVIFLFISTALQAAEPTIYKRSVERPASNVYDALYAGLEAQRLWVVFEANIGENLKGMAKRLGDEYNRNQLDGIRSIVVCNPWYANAVSNADPDMLGLCPLRLTVTHKGSVTTVLFARPSVIAKDSPALPVVQEIENKIISAIETATK